MEWQGVAAAGILWHGYGRGDPPQVFYGMGMAGGSAAGILWHIFFSATRINIFRKYCHEIPAAAFGAMRGGAWDRLQEARVLGRRPGLPVREKESKFYG